MSEKEDLAVPGQLATRRQVMAGLAIALGGFAFRPAAAMAATEEEITKQFDQITKLSPEMRAGMSLGDKATEISGEVGGAFTLFGGHIVGRQVELVPGERIVQAWRVVDWDPGVYSIAKFELLEQGSGTKVVFDHTGFPKGQAEHLAAGWKAHYWETIEKFLG
jgi:activator of HSP90 ATPase